VIKKAMHTTHADYTVRTVTLGFLAVLAMRRSSDTVRVVIVIPWAALLAPGWVARVALGAHWPSDVIISYYV
jgi:membrane-associated phospholipid phosphatase